MFMRSKHDQSNLKPKTAHRGGRYSEKQISARSKEASLFTLMSSFCVIRVQAPPSEIPETFIVKQNFGILDLARVCRPKKFSGSQTTRYLAVGIKVRARRCKVSTNTV